MKTKIWVKPPPLPHVFDLRAPKSIDFIWMVMSLYLVNFNDLAQAILALKRESQNYGWPPPCPPFFTDVHQKQ